MNTFFNFIVIIAVEESEYSVCRAISSTINAFTSYFWDVHKKDKKSFNSTRVIY